MKNINFYKDLENLKLNARIVLEPLGKILHQLYILLQN